MPLSQRTALRLDASYPNSHQIQRYEKKINSIAPKGRRALAPSAPARLSVAQAA
jgi:hypothetical protein